MREGILLVLNAERYEHEGWAGPAFHRRQPTVARRDREKCDLGDLSRVGRSSCAPTRDGLPASPGLPVASRAQCQMGRLPAFNCAGTLLAVPPAAAAHTRCMRPGTRLSTWMASGCATLLSQSQPDTRSCTDYATARALLGSSDRDRAARMPCGRE